MSKIPSGFEKEHLLHLYQQMVMLRRCEEGTQKTYKEGKLPGFIHLYIGEEAVAVGVCDHLRKDDWVTSTHRGHGHALAKGVSPKAVLAELAAKTTGCSGGRGGSMHMYDVSAGLFGTNGLVGGGIPLATGLGISSKIRKTDQATVCFFGDGAVNHGTFHESINLAGIQNAPVVFVCENNQYATCTPFKDTTKNPDVSSKAAAYGIPGVAVDGNDVLAVWQVAKEAIERARCGQGPTLIEARTYRHVGHHEGDALYGTYRTEEEVKGWMERCPLLLFRKRLIEAQIATEQELNEIDSKFDQEIQEAVEFALSSPDPDPATVHDHVFAQPINPAIATESQNHSETIVQGWMEAVRDGLTEEMREDENIIYFGEGIGERGGSWGHTKNLWHEFGAERVIDTPISELGFTGAAIGASASGCRAVSDLMVSDFLFDAGSQIVDQAAKLRYMSNGQISVPVIIRSGAGTIKNTGPHHSATYHPVWSHIPGLIVVMPSNPADAKGLMKTALRAGDPVIYHEHKALLSTKGPVPVGEHFVPFGKAKVVKEGSDLTIVSCGLLLNYSVKAAEILEADGISCEVIDLRTIVPLDIETIISSVSKTGKLLIVDEAYAMCGIGAEIAAAVMEEAFDELDAPVGRLHTETGVHPFAPALEDAVTVNVDKIIQAANSVIAGTPIVPKRIKTSFGSVSQTSESDASINAVAEEYIEEAKSSEVDGIPLIMPNQDLTITEATIVKWIKGVGDVIEEGECVLEVETDKAAIEIESPATGILAEILAPEGAVVALGQRIGTIKPE